MRNGLFLFFLVWAGSVLAQTPPFQPGAATQPVIAAQPAPCDCSVIEGKYEATKVLLDKTRRASEAVFAEKDARIKYLVEQANKKLTNAYDREGNLVERVQEEVGQKALARSMLLLMRDNIKGEGERKRFLGFGRKTWCERQIKEIDKFLTQE